jgi:hypothetical protein
MRFAELLAPVLIEDFVSKHSEKRALYIPGRAEKVAELFDRGRLFAIVNSGVANDAIVLATFSSAENGHGAIKIQPRHFSQALQAGMRVTVEEIDSFDPVLRDLVDDTRQALAIPERVHIGSFISPPGWGFPVHYDAVPNWVIQIEGRKRWHYSELPAREHPPGPYVPTAEQLAQGVDGLDESRLRSVELSPGDVLYLPPGTWHRTTSLDAQSLHLSMLAEATSLFSLFERLVTRSLPPSWTRLPWGAAASDLVRRRDELVTALQGLSPSELHAEWKALVPRSKLRSVHIERDTQLRRSGEITFAIERGNASDGLLLLADQRVIGSLPTHARVLVQQIAHVAEFRADDAVRWDDYEWEDVSVLLALLVEFGALQVVADAGTNSSG